MPTPAEREVLARFPGFGALALDIFPDPITESYKNHSWQALGEELQSLLSPDDYASAKRTTFNAFYTSPIVIAAIYQALERLGLSQNPLILEPGCGSGRFMNQAHAGQRFIGVELDRTSGRVARALHPRHDIRIENFRDTRFSADKIDAVVGNVPFADLKLEHQGQRFSLHDFFFAKSVDALKPGGLLALVTSHYTLDKQNGAIRDYLAQCADFQGAIRLPSDAFEREGTKVVTDIIFLRKRAPGEHARHEEAEWQRSMPFEIDGVDVPINRYFQRHPEMVLGDWSRKDTLYGGENQYSLRTRGHLEDLLKAAVERLPERKPTKVVSQAQAPAVPSFVAPAPTAPLGEGSFVVGEDGLIRQMQEGEMIPVVYGGVKLAVGRTVTGRRLAALVGLRDRARRVLQSQNEGWPDSRRAEARRELNRAYDRFTAAFGPINKTSFGETSTGAVIRRMPNLVKFREDPDAMLVMSLEEYDEVTGEAKKSAILLKDVVGKTPPITTVQNAEEGLLVSLDQRGVVDLPFIARLYGQPEERVITELESLIYLDPETNSWQTADAYLSGNVRAKLKAAVKAGPAFAGNVQILNDVQPEDVLPGDIDAPLGAPWIPVSDIQAFAVELFQADPSAIEVSHLPKDAVWSFDAGYTVEQSVAATSEFGTSRINGTRLFELALNMKAPVIYDTIQTANSEAKVVNQEETVAAREKQKQIKEKFRSWIFADPDRTERLVRIYNDTYNNLRPRLFDGSHLEFPGMNRTISLRQHQKDAIWRGMSSGNTLLAHAVGAGKTFTMAATGMKLKQAGLVKKPMYVVPNHMLEQFAREFLQLYPNARLLVAGKDDLTRDRRKFLTAKIASGEWDGIIVTHSSFERIGMSRRYQEQFLKEQIEDYERLLCDAASSSESRGRRNLIKTIEKQKAQREERLKDLLAEDKKDDGLVFDELGVDHVFIDEAHYFKNLETPTKIERVAGIQTGGSERAFDLFMKARYLHERHPGHGVTFATGTPISNTMVELYTMQRFLDLEGLVERGIDHFDAWAATFGEVVETMEVAPDGASLRPRSRFARFINLPELQQMFRAFADVQTAAMLNLPRPNLETGKPIIVACPLSDEQHALQQKLVERYERLRTSRIDPREDNALAVTTDGRKLALDARLLSADASDYAESKLNALIDRAAAIWERTASSRGTQMIFCDMGVHPTAWGYSVYEEITDKLVQRGIPRSQIAAIGDADSDAKKQALFEQVRKGSIRVLLGSTQKMGVGTNVQKRLVALHHLDAPWKPAEVEQREGRILRQGNENAEVAIYRYVTEGSFDAYMWQALETKARFIAQVITGDNTLRHAEDIGGQELSFAEVKAIATGNPAVLTLAEADAELKRLVVLQRNHADDQFIARRNLRTLPETIRGLSTRLEALAEDRETSIARVDDPITIAGRECRKGDVMDRLGRQLDALPTQVSDTQRIPLGMFRGLSFGVVLDPHFSSLVFLTGKTTRSTSLSREHSGPRAVLNALERLVTGYPSECAKTEQDLEIAQKQLRDYEARIGSPFVHEAYQKSLTDLRDQLKQRLSGAAPDAANGPNENAAEIAEQIKTLRASNSVEAVPQRTATRRSSAEEPITARIRRKGRESIDAEMMAREASPESVARSESKDEHAIGTDIPNGTFQNRVDKSRRLTAFDGIVPR